MIARRWWQGGVGVILATMVAGCGRSASDADEKGAEIAVHVRVARLEQRSFPERVTAPGQWRAANEIVVTAPFAAAVESLRPRAGDTVVEGETIGALITHESRATLRGAELMLQQATDDATRAEARRAVDLARRELVRVPLVATASGTVVRRAVEPGAEVADAAELLALVPPHDLVFEAHVAGADAGRVRVGQPATITVDAASTVDASVQRRLPGVSSEDQSVLVWLAPRAEPQAAIGRYGTAHIEAGTPRPGIAVPDSALVEDDLTGETRVARVDTSGIAIWTPVRLGRAVDGCHELLSPALPLGTPVVITGQRGLPDSVKVTVR